AAGTAGRAGNAVAADELAIPRQDAALAAAGTVPEDGFRYVLAGNANLVAAVGVGNAALVDGVGNRLANVLAETAYEPLPVDGAFVAALLTAVNDEERHGASPRLADPQIPLRQQTNLLLRVA